MSDAVAMTSDPPADSLLAEAKALHERGDVDGARVAYERLAEAHPDKDPLQIRFTDLHKMVMELPGFADDAESSNEGKLEAIQMAWYEEYKENHG